MMRAALALLALVPATALRVTVLGGNGYVGQRVCEKLVARGCDVTSISKSGKAPSGAWTQSVKWVANDLTRGSRQELEAAVGQPDVAVSCVGTVGFDGRGLELGNGVANVRAAEALKGVQRYVLVSVASEVAAAKGWLPGYFEFYFKGKAMAEAAAAEAAGEGNAYVVKPSFIYGGDSFELFPPRVASGYGAAIEEILSNAIITKIADVLPGLLKVALRPPSSVDAVAEACVRCAVGDCATTVLDVTVAINEAAGADKATGFSDFVGGLSTN